MTETMDFTPCQDMMHTSVSTAIVTDNNDPDALGRVKLRYPWSTDGSESSWVRVSTIMAGHEQGFYFMPEVEQEVLVVFVNNDVEYPIVIGTLWNQSYQPPGNTENQENDIKMIQSRMGHKIVFNDNEGGEGKLEISSKSGHKILLDDNGSIVIEDSAGSSIEFDANSSAIKIKSSMDVSIEAVNINIKASGQLTLEGAIVSIN